MTNTCGESVWRNPSKGDKQTNTVYMIVESYFKGLKVYSSLPLKTASRLSVRQLAKLMGRPYICGRWYIDRGICIGIIAKFPSGVSLFSIRPACSPSIHSLDFRLNPRILIMMLEYIQDKIFSVIKLCFNPLRRSRSL